MLSAKQRATGDDQQDPLSQTPAEPAQHVATLVSRPRRVPGPDVIQGGRRGYQLAGGPTILVDLDEAAKACPVDLQ